MHVHYTALMADETGGDGPKAEKRSSKPIRLTNTQRGMAVVGGVGMLIAGGWGYIASGHDGAGTVAFVTAGAVAGLLGVVGRVPNRLSGRDYSMELFEEALDERVKEEVTDIVEDLPATARKEIVEAEDRRAVATDSSEETVDLLAALQRSVDRAKRVKVASTAAARSLAFEDQVTTQLRRAFELSNVAVEIESSREATDRGLDVIVHFRDFSLGVAITTRDWTVRQVRELIQDAMTDRELRLSALLLVSEATSILSVGGSDEIFSGYPTPTMLKHIVDKVLNGLGYR